MYGEEVAEVSPMIPVVFALITSSIYAFRTVYVKIFVNQLHFNSFDYLTYSYIVSGVAFAPFVFQSMYYHGFIVEVVVLGIASGLLSCLGAYFMFYATTNGITGPAYSLKSIEPVVQTIFGAVFLEAHLNMSQFIAVVLGIFGSLVISIGPYLFRSKEQVDKDKKIFESATRKNV